MELKELSSAVAHQGEGHGAAKLGYCPQENVLWPILTVKEHLEVYAAVKGLRKKDAVIAISRYHRGSWNPLSSRGGRRYSQWKHYY